MCAKCIFFNLAKAFFLIVVTSGPAFANEDSSGNTIQTGSSTQIESSFVLGMRHLKAEEPELAIKQFLLILAQNPSLVRVRLELARAYYLNRQWERSRNEFFRVLSSDLPEPVRANVLKFIRAIDARRGFDWDLSIGVTSIGEARNYKTNEVLLSLGGLELPFTLEREKSNEIGLRLAGSANFRKPLQYQVFGLEVVSFASMSFDLREARASVNDDYQFVGRVGARFLSPRTTFSIGPVVSTRIVSGEVFENRYAWNAAFEHRGLLGGSFFGALTAANLYNQNSSNLDGYETVGEFGFRRSVYGRNILGFSVFIEDKNVDYGFENYLTRGMRIFGSFDLRAGLTVSPSIFVAQKRFRGASPLLIGDPDETSYGAAVRIEKSNVFWGNGFSPFAEFEYKETSSGIDAFSYNESRFSAGLERRF